MYKHLIIGLACILSLTLLSCQRESRQIVGDYSYKLSGEVAITGEDGDVTYHLIHRNGQMNILKDRSQDNEYIITMNEMNGSGYTLSANQSDDELLIAPHTFTTTVITSDGISLIDLDNSATIVYRVTASGSGKKSDDILIIKEHWQGEQSGNPTVRLSAPEITIIAEKN